MIRALTFVCVALGISLIALLFQASSNNTFFAAYYTWLFALGIALTAGLLALICYQVFLLWRKLKGRVFGAKLALRLMAVFALMAVIPGGLVYTISVQFLNRSIDSWFDVPVDKALEGALSLGRGALDAALTDLTRRGRNAAVRLNDHADAQPLPLSELRAQTGADELILFAADGAVIAQSGPKAKLFADKPTVAEIKEALQKAPVRATETNSEGQIYFRVIVPVAARAPLEAPQALQLIQAAQKKFVADSQAVEAGVRDYQQLNLQRQDLKRLFALTLTLAMVLTLFSAISLSFLLSERLSAPLSALAESTRAIAKGDFSKLNPVKSRDEFGVLTQSFNTMTRQLAEASDVVARKQHELENSKTYLEAILGNLSSGVLTLDERLYAKTINRNAEAMLGISHDSLRGSKLSEWASVAPLIGALVQEILHQIATPRDRPWQRQVQFENPQGVRTLLVRGTKLPASIDSGYVLVFDDITELIQAQRDAAWGEVARRLAHEIKNPLTPIQLSAERLQHKLADKLPEAERELLQRSTQTIVSQVGALKNMVDDFSLYSHSTRIVRAPLSLNALVKEVLVLYESMNIELDIVLDPAEPNINADSALIRQVIHNLMQNALDAMHGVASPRIQVQTELLRNANDGQTRSVSLSVQDNGSGVPADMRHRIFEPYVTTKAKGTGLGLAIVRRIVEEHEGTVTIENAKPGGTVARIVLPTVEPGQAE